MATINLTNPLTSGTNQSFIYRNDVGFIELNVRAADAVISNGGTALANADVIQLMDLPAGTYIEGAVLEVVTADTDAAADITANIGYTSAADVFVDGADLSATGFADPGTNGDLTANAVVISTDDTLTLTLGQATAFASNDDWVIRVYVKLTDLSTSGRARSAKDARV